MIQGAEWLQQVDQTQINDPVLLSLFWMGVLDWTGPNDHLHQTTQVVHVIRRYFYSYFSSIFDPTSLHIPYPTFLPYAFLVMFIPLCSSRSQTNDKNTIRLVLLVTEQLVYWATDIPKQSCCGSPSPGSCAGTSSAATERSHHSQFWTSRTQNTSRSASIARMLRVIDRFLATTAARSPQPTATMR